MTLGSLEIKCSLWGISRIQLQITISEKIVVALEISICRATGKGDIHYTEYIAGWLKMDKSAIRLGLFQVETCFSRYYIFFIRDYWKYVQHWKKQRSGKIH